MKRTSTIALISAFLFALLAGPASAHPAYKDSSPQADATVADPPTEVWVEFTESIDAGTISVFDPCGEQVDHGDEELNLTSDRLTTGTHADKAGTYTVKWHVVGSDSHETQGEFAFTSTGGTSCPQEETEEPTAPRDNNRHRERTPDTTAEEDEPSADVEHPARHQHAQKHRHPARTKDRVKGRRETKTTTLTQQAPEPASDKGIWDGIPMGDFFIALTVAALIGAAGGRIYAGIIGPRR
ncbi:MAG: copper resistance protein [Actinomycetota bacterium]|jgi:methionine-rich copper-binding protein CopC|nr:copper resistance protein [Actinomycetota bacterium]